MDKVADFYERWYATKRIPDYSGVDSASEELAKQLLGVYESEKRDFWQTCDVQFLRGTILHLACQAHLYGAPEVGFMFCCLLRRRQSLDIKDSFELLTIE